MNSIITLTNAPGLLPEEYRLLVQLVQRWQSSRPRNHLRTLYYDGERSLRRAGQLGMSVPPQLGKLETVIGWPAKSVEVLDNRLDLQGFVMANQAEADDSLAEIIEDNQLLVESSQAHIASMIHGVAFATISAGDETVGEPPVVIQTRSATEGSALWSQRSRRIVAGMTINEGIDGVESPELNLWMSDRVVTIWQEGNSYQVLRQPHSLGKVPMVMLAHRPRLNKRYGMSRITRPLMDLTDAAARTVIRMEGTAEFFSFPQRWITGVDEDDFDEDMFVTYLNRLLTLGADEDGNQPSLGTFSAASPQPHIDQLRAIAMMVAGETSIPPDSLGIIQDNPSSADAIRATEAELVKVAERAQLVYGSSWCEVMRLAQHARDGTPDGRLSRLQAKWRDPSTPTKAAAAQSVMSLATAGVLPPQSEVTWEQLGFDPVTISRLKADALRNQGAGMLNQLLTGAQQASTQSVAAVADEK
ncbi:phage portal protein [Corynebacterium flavescens]|uniref:phage portal protein n=1 Tax=Corynebacterium flavescens TaxID=28028 RepID=UPI00289E95E7|nr:phage portal protein [Corynebacterium flavescens]